MKRSVISNGAWNAAAKFSSSGKVNAMARCNIALIIGDYIPSHLTNIRFLRIGNRQPKPQIHLFRTHFFLLFFDFLFSLFSPIIVSGVVYIAFQLCKIAINRTDYAGQLLLSIYPLSIVWTSAIRFYGCGLWWTVWKIPRLHSANAGFCYTGSSPRFFCRRCSTSIQTAAMSRCVSPDTSTVEVTFTPKR